MRKIQKTLCLLLSIMLLLCLWGCQSEPVETVPPTTAPPEPTAQELYEQATAALCAEDYVGLVADITRTVTVGAETYTKTSQQQITWKGWDTEELGAKIIDSTTIGETTRRYTEVLRDGTVYISGEGLAYVSDIAPEDFQTRWPALILLDMSLYGSVSKEDAEDGVVIRFEDAQSPEIWAAPDYARLSEASGTAQINLNGELTNFTYSAKFRQGSAEIELSAEIEINEPRGLDLTLTYPEGDDRYVYVSHPDIPWLLMEAHEYLQLSESVTSVMTGSMSSEALDASCVQTTSVQTSGIGDDHVSNMMDILTVQTSWYEETYSWNHKFADGVYSMSYCDGTPEEDSSITATGMRNSCLSWITAIYPPYVHITGATLTDFGSICLIELDCSVALAQAYSDYL